MNARLPNVVAPVDRLRSTDAEWLARELAHGPIEVNALIDRALRAGISSFRLVAASVALKIRLKRTDAGLMWGLPVMPAAATN